MAPLYLPKFVKKIINTSINDIPEINSRISKIISKEPKISIAVIAWNEEKNILKCLNSLSYQKTNFGIEIIVIDNNSTDNTFKLAEQCGVKVIKESKQGYGFARQAGLTNAQGEILLSADADCIYPPHWANSLAGYLLSHPNYSSSYSRFSYFPEKNESRFSLAIYEWAKDFMGLIRHINRPEQNAGGASFAMRKKWAIEINYPMDGERGEDGRMAYALSKKGKIKYLTSNKSRIWTGTRSLQREGNIISNIISKVWKELKRSKEYLFKEKNDYNR